MSLPISPGAGLVVDFFASRYRKKNKELRGRTIGVAVVCAFCSISVSTHSGTSGAK